MLHGSQFLIEFRPRSVHDENGVILLNINIVAFGIFSLSLRSTYSQDYIMFAEREFLWCGGIRY